MRAFWVSVLALAILSACFVLNYGFICRFADTMDALIQALPPDDSMDTTCFDSVNAPLAFLDNHRDLLSLTVPLSVLHELEDAASDVIVYYNAKERASYAEARSRLSDALDAFRDTEIFHWLGIF